MYIEHISASPLEIDERWDRAGILSFLNFDEFQARLNAFDGELLHLHDIWSFRDNDSKFYDTTVSMDWAFAFSRVQSQVINVADQEDPEVKFFTGTGALNCSRSPVV